MRTGSGAPQVKEVASPRCPVALVTAVLDEQEFLPGLAASVVSQTLTPALWVIVDDGSTDSSLDLLKEIEKSIPWVVIITRPGPHERTDLSMATVFDFAMRSASHHMQRAGIAKFVLGKVDADVILAPRCVEACVSQFETDVRLGIVGPSLGRAAKLAGHQLEFRRGSPFLITDEPADGVRFYRSECLETIGWVPLQVAPDTAMLEIARAREWKTSRLPDTLAWLQRNTGATTSAKAVGVRLAGRRYSVPLAASFLFLERMVSREKKALPAFYAFLEEVAKRRLADGDQPRRTLTRQLAKLRIY